MSAESPRHARSGGPLTVPSQPPSESSIIDAVSGFINDVTLSSSSNVDPKDVIQWARFETADINEPTPEGDSDNDISPLLLILGYGSGVQVWLIPPNGEAQEVLSWRQGTVRVLRILPTPQHGDCFASKRPLIALCDSASPGPTFCSLSFISIRCGEQVKSIKFKNPILDVLANKRSVVVSFSERFAVFDAATLEDRMAITTCYPCPCPLGGSMPINPLALGDRWLAYADKKLNQSKRSSGGCEGEGVTSYTATVLHAAKSLSKGLRGLGESVAHSLAGGRSTSQSPSPPNADIQQPGVVTVVDIEGNDEDDGQDSEEPYDPIVAHFIAHSEAIIALKFDASGMLLVTADRRGHDFHVFRINPHPCGPSLASVHHLYILHRGDTTAKVQDIAISGDSRWTAISTLRGTTHVFAISPYGGSCGVRTHTQPRVVNRLSRFHRSAGLPIHAPAHAKRASGSPVGDGLSAGSWYPNPRLPPYPLPITSAPLAQLRPTANLPTHTITRTSSGRQRLSSLSEDSNSVPLLARARFGIACGNNVLPRGTPAPVTALYLMTANGTLLHLVLHPRPLSGVPKEKICDESPIELQVEGLAQWALQRPAAAADLLAPLPPANPLLRPHPAAKCADICMSEEERWLSQVEIVTHAGPHRRLWMGPQFVFKTYNCMGSSSSLSEAETVEVDTSAARGVARSNPVNMPGVRPIVPVLIDSGSASSVEHSPSDSFRRKSLLSESGRAASLCDVQLKEDLAEAMKEDHGWREQRRSAASAVVARAVDPLGCVVQARGPPAAPDVEAEADADAYTRDNADEATFRPVVRAPASLPPAALLLRPLPRTTTIPVQPLAGDAPPAPARSPRELLTHIVIPAALGAAGPDFDDPRAPTLPDYRPSDIQAAPLRESPTRASFDDASCKVSECVRVCEAPTDGVGAIASRDREPPAEDSTIDKRNDEICSVSGGDDSEKIKPIESDPERPPSRRSGKSVKCTADDVVLPVDVTYSLAKKVDKRSKDKSPSSQKRNNKKESKALMRDDKRSEISNSEIYSTAFECAPKLAEISVADFSYTAQSEVSEALITTSTSSYKSTVGKDTMSSARKVELSYKKRSKESSPFAGDIKSFPVASTDVLSCTSQQVKVVEVSQQKSVSSVKSADKKETKSASRKEILPSTRSSKESSPLSTDNVHDSSIEKRSSSFTSTEKKESQCGLRKIELSSMRRSKDSSSVVDEVKQSSEVLVEKSFAAITENLNATPEISSHARSKYKRESESCIRKSEMSNTRRSEERVSCLGDSETTDIVAKETYTSLAKELREASQEKAIVEISDSDPISSIKIRSIKSSMWPENEIKTEEQAWDMLLSEPDKPSSSSATSTSIIEDKTEDSKPKSKRNRKVKKSLEESQSKSDENSFVEIHAIEEKQQPPCDDLVSISSPFEDVDTCSSYLAKTKKSRSFKSLTPERTYEIDQNVGDVKNNNDFDASCKIERKMTDIDVLTQSNATFKSADDSKSKSKSNTLIVNQSIEAGKETSDFNRGDLLKPRKSKSLSPYVDSRKSIENFVESDIKDVYVIDSTTEEFPEIQITRSNKSRRKSPMCADSKPLENQLNLEKPVKSWSSIAASKSVKKVDELEFKCDVKNIELDSSKLKKFDKVCDYKEVASGSDVNFESSKEISLQEKLYELCKRRDIMVAECDVPSELNFVEEHHSVLHDLPPLEPLDFGLDDFKLEVMRDSLLEVNETKLTSPICKINIDDILSSLKETTTKAVESSTFNLIDLQKVPAKKEKGFSVIESQKITSQEIKIDDDREAEIMEKSSDDDNTSPVTSTDSDKDDKKIEASRVALPSAKQQAKAKKSRRKKK